jgi:predicted transcriptional regulator
LKSVFEFASKHIEPSIKKSLIHKLMSRGASRSYISKCLNISPSLITRYSRGERGLHDFTVISEVDRALDKIADEAIKGELCGSRLYIEIAKLTMTILSKKYACGIHYLATKDVDPSKCNICPSIFIAVNPATP